MGIHITLASLWEADTPLDSILGISHIAIYTGKVSLLIIYSVDKSGWLNSQENKIKLEATYRQKSIKETGKHRKKGP